MIVTVPGTSRLCAVPWLSGSRRGASATPIAHSGTFTANTAGHPSACTNAPPSTQPDAPPAAAAAVNQATPRRRSGSVATSASAAGASAAAPMPCTARAPTSAAADGANAQASDAAPNTASPTRNIRRRPAMSPARPVATSRPPNVSVYAVRIHCSPSGESPNERCIAGSAIATIVTSSTTMNWAAQSSVTGKSTIAGIHDLSTA